MTYYYVDPTATGANDGGGDGAAGDPTDSANWTDAWASLQTAADTAVAGDTVYCRGTESVSAQIDFDTNSGTDGYANRIQFVGVNAAGAEEDAAFTIDGGANNVHCMQPDAISYVEWRNFRFTHSGATTSNGVHGGIGDCTRLLFRNCRFDNNVYGFNHGSYTKQSTFNRCLFDNNSSVGCLHREGLVEFCRAYANGGHGFGTYGSYGVRLVSCVSHGNTGRGYSTSNMGMINCVAHGNTDDGIYLGSMAAESLVIGCRSTGNGGYGLHLNAAPLACTPMIGCYFGDNDLGTYNTYQTIEIGCETAGTDLNGGYIDPDNGNFNLRADATGRNIPVVLP